METGREVIAAFLVLDQLPSLLDVSAVVAIGVIDVFDEQGRDRHRGRLRLRVSRHVVVVDPHHRDWRSHLILLVPRERKPEGRIAEDRIAEIK